MSLKTTRLGEAHFQLGCNLVKRERPWREFKQRSKLINLLFNAHFMI